MDGTKAIQMIPVDAMTLLEKVNSTVLVVGTCWLVALTGRWFARGRRDPLLDAPERPNRLTPDLAIVPVVAWTMGLYGCHGILELSMGGQGELSEMQREVQTMVSSSVAQLLGSAGCLYVGRRFFAEGLSGFGLDGQQFGRHVVFGGAALLAIWPVLFVLYEAATAVLIGLWPDFELPAHQLLKTLDEPDTPAWVGPMLWAGAVVIAPVGEELFFRGVIQTCLGHVFVAQGARPAANVQVQASGETDAREEGGGTDEVPTSQAFAPVAGPGDTFRSRWLPILVTGAVFGIIHFPQPQAVPALAFFGVAMGYLYHRTGSLVGPITMHVLFNLKTMVFHTLTSP